MTTGSLKLEAISFRQITGTPFPRRITIDEWGNQYSVGTFTKYDWSDAGRLWCKVDGADLKVYRAIKQDGTFEATDEVLRGTIAAVGPFALAQQNASGLSGEIELQEYSDGDLFDLIVTYADERDIDEVLSIEDQASALDTIVVAERAKTERWQERLLQAKKELDRELIASFGRQTAHENVADGRNTSPFKLDARGRWMLAALASPEQLVRAHVFRVAMLLCEKRATFNSTFRALYEFYEARYKETMKQTRLIIDHTADQVVDAEAKTKRPARELERG